MQPFVVRAAQRRAIRRFVPMTCRVVRERDFVQVSERALDISPDGMLVPCEAELLEGDEMIVSFRATEIGIWFDTDAVVARVVEGRRPGDRGRCVGLRFRSLDAVSRLILRGHLRRYPPPVPKREQRIDYAATVGVILSIPSFGGHGF